MEATAGQPSKVDKAQLTLYGVSLCCMLVNLALGGRAEFLRLIAVVGVALYVVVSSVSATPTKPIRRVTDLLLALAVLFLFKPTVFGVIVVLILIALSGLESQRKISVLILGCFLLMTDSAVSLTRSVWERL